MTVFRHEIRDDATNRLIASASPVQRGPRAGQWRVVHHRPDEPARDRIFVGTYAEAMQSLLKCALGLPPFDSMHRPSSSLAPDP